MAAGLCVVISAVSVTQGHAQSDDQIFRLLTADPACDAETAGSLAAAAREGIENAVRRAEAAIKAPIPTGDLACLDDLMDLNLDFAITLPDLGGMFAGAVSNATDHLCSFARDKWNELTKPLNANFDLSLPGFQDGWGEFNFGGSGSSQGGGYAPGGNVGQIPEAGSETGESEPPLTGIPQPDVACTAPAVPMFDSGNWTWFCSIPSDGVTPQVQQNWNSMWGY